MQLKETLYSLVLIVIIFLTGLGLNAAPMPGDVDNSFLPDILPAAVLPLPGGRVAVVGHPTQRGSFVDSSTLEFVLLNPDGSVGSGPWDVSASLSSAMQILQLKDGGFLLCGSFDQNGQESATVLKINDHGEIAPGFGLNLGLNGLIWRCLEMPDNTIWAAGDFTDPKNPNLSGLIRLTEEGQFDPTFNYSGGARFTNQPARIFAMIPDTHGMVLVGGNFDTLNGTFRPGLARLFPNGLTDETYQPALQKPSAVRALSFTLTGDLLVGGQLYQPNRIISVLTQLKSNGSTDPLFHAPNFTFNYASTKMAIAVDAQGYILFSGAFTAANGNPNGSFVRLAPDGEIDSNFGAYQMIAIDPQISISSLLAIDSNGDSYHWTQGTFKAPYRSFLKVKGGNPERFAPQILNLPDIATRSQGDRFTVYANCAGYPPPAIQWFLNGVAISGANSPGLELPEVQPWMNGVISVSASNDLGSVTQQMAILLVLPKPQGPGDVDTTFRFGYVDPANAYCFAVKPSGQIALGSVATTDPSLFGFFGFTLDSLTNPALVTSLSSPPTSIIPLSGNDWLLLGKLGQVGGIQASNCVKIRSDGQIDPQFTPLQNIVKAPVTALLLKDGRLCIGGGLVRVAGKDLTTFGLFDSNGHPDGSFPIHGFNMDGTIQQIFETSDGHLVAAGNWLVVEGKTHPGLLQVGLDGAIDDAAYSGLDAAPSAFVQYPDGRIMVAVPPGGSHPKQSIFVRFTADGQLDANTPKFSAVFGTISTLCLDQESRLIVGGVQSLSLDGLSFRPFLRFNSSEEPDLSFEQDLSSPTPAPISTRSAVTLPDGRIAAISGGRMVALLSSGISTKAPRLLSPLVDVGAQLTTPAGFSAAVEGENLQFDWYVNGTITDQHNALYPIPYVGPASFGDYFFVAKNDFGAVTSNIAHLAPLSVAPVVASGGIAQIYPLFIGESMVLGIAISGSEPMRGQWYRSGQPVAGAVVSPRRFYSLESKDGGDYDYYVSNPLGAHRYPSGHLTIWPESTTAESVLLPSLRWASDRPELWVSSTSALSDGKEVLKCNPPPPNSVTLLQTKVIGPGTLKFRWRAESTDASDKISFGLSQTPSSYLVPLQNNLSASGRWLTNSFEVAAGAYYPTWAVNRKGNTSGSGNLLLDAVSYVVKSPSPPRVTAPIGLRVYQGAPLQLAVDITSQLPYTVQWRHDDQPVPGEVSSVLTRANADVSLSGSWDVEVQSTAGTTISAKAQIVVSDTPTPVKLGALSAGGLEIQIPSEAGRFYRVEASDDLIHWFDPKLWVPPSPSGTVISLDMLGRSRPQRFYRTVVE